MEDALRHTAEILVTDSTLQLFPNHVMKNVDLVRGELFEFFCSLPCGLNLVKDVRLVLRSEYR